MSAMLFNFFPGLDVLPLPTTPSIDGTNAGQNWQKQLNTQNKLIGGVKMSLC